MTYLVASLTLDSASPSMKASISFSVFGTMFGHKTANSWNLLIPDDLVGLLYSNRFGIGISPGQGILDESTSSKFHFVVLESKTSRDGHGDNGIRDPIGGLVSLVDLTGNEDPINEDGDTRVGDSEVSVSLGDICSGGRKSQELSIGDTEDGGKVVGRAIIVWSRGRGNSLSVASYTGMTSIYGSSCKGKKTSVAKRYLIKSPEELGGLFPDVAGK
nr:hypothetical protein [Tanacetum cinerariifolium]